MTEPADFPGYTPSSAALPRDSDPAPWLEAHFRQLWLNAETRPAHCNPALDIEAIGFARHRGDWLGVVVTPWFLRLYLVCGGGSLWGDIPDGQRRFVDLPYATLPFVAESAPETGPLQYSTLVEPIGEVADMAAARALALDALQAYLPPPASAVAPAPVVAIAPEPAPEPVSRRGFFRRLAGKR
jgi:[NiFe] hydrogenase assembly HybE family chaperone